MKNNPSKEHSAVPSADSDTFGDDALDALLEEGVLKGYARMDLALAVAGVFIVVMWGFFTYFYTPNLPFIHEDFERIVENPALHSLSTMSEGWDGRTIRPLTGFSYALDWQIGGGTPGIFHFTNALIHVLNAAMLFLLCRRLFVPDRASDAICLVPALLFLVHPSFSAPALYISNQAVLFGTLFALRAILFYIGPRAADPEESPYGLSLTFALVSFTLAWGAHTAVWALPIVFAASDRAVFGRVRWRRLAPMAFLAAAFLVVHMTTRRAMDDAIPGLLGLWQHAGTFGEFLENMLDFGTPVPEYSERDWSMLGLVSWLAVLFGGLAAFRFVPRVGLALVWTSVLFVSQGLLFSPMRSTDAYLAFAGTMIVVPLGIGYVSVGTRRSAVGAVAAVLVFVLSVTTFLHTFAWDDEESLLLETIESCPECEAINDRLARLYINRARQEHAASRRSTGTTQGARHAESAREAYSAAVSHIEYMIEREPEDAALWLHLGEAKGALGDREDMIAAYERARLVDPWSGEASLRLANALVSGADGPLAHGELIRAVDLYRVAHAAGAFNERHYAQFAQLLTQLGNFEAADEILRAGIEKTDSSALRRLQERNRQSIDALQRRADRIATLTGREKTYEQANLLHLRRQFLKSSYLVEADLHEHGFHEPMWLLLARNKAEMDQLDRFIEEYRGRATIPPETWSKLAQAFEEAGNAEAAEAVLNATAQSQN